MNFSKFNFLSNTKGNIVTAVLISTATLSILSLGVSHFTQLTKRPVSDRVKDISVLIENQLRAVILNEVAWRNTMNASANQDQLICLLELDPPEHCLSHGQEIEGGLILLSGRFDESDSPRVFISTKEGATENGFTEQGVRCNTYPEGQCSIKLTLNIKTHCDPGGCSRKDRRGVAFRGWIESARISGRSTGGFKKALNKIIRTPIVGLSDDVCADLQDNEDRRDGTPVCRTSLMAKSCPEGEVLKGFLDGNLVCSTR